MDRQMDAGPIHPGHFVRKEIIPGGLTVTEAAKLLGVGRPALSNFLNGKAALSPAMAMRIEKAFGADRTELLEMQARFDESAARAHEDELAVRAYVQPYFNITAAQIEDWSKSLDARAQLPALLRILVQSTCEDLVEVDFPAFDNSQRKGWDGLVESEKATPWVPRGKSAWEFGCDKTPQRKAQSDYEKRTMEVASAVRRVTSYVFVTPRNWTGKKEWADEKKARGDWKDVRAFDASDLEQWIEQSVPAQTRFKEFSGSGTQEICSLEEIWQEWSEVTDPTLVSELFASPVAKHWKKLDEWLVNRPTQPFVITADSQLEALAFLKCALDQPASFQNGVSSRALVIRSIDAFKRLNKAVTNCVVIVASTEAEQALGGLHKKAHTIIVKGRNTVSDEPNISLDQLSYEEMKAGLSRMGLSNHRIDGLILESGNSLTILRRCLSQVDGIKTPPWAGDQTILRKLIALTFVGAWDSRNIADREILECLLGCPYKEIEKTTTQLLQVDESPIWSIGSLRGVVSQKAALFAICRSITRNDIEDLLFAIEIVLGEEDPALELPKEKRWAANLYGKSRDHSPTLRKCLRETLVLLAVYGNTLLGKRLDINFESAVGQLVNRLLTPFESSTWLSQRNDLTKYAEAVPDVFLGLLEEDLKSESPKVAVLLAPAESAPFGDCPRAGLLWALELLAWKPERLTRVCSILAMLSSWKIEDNWSNTPLRSLESIFRCWMPQTAASAEERNLSLKTLSKRFPKVGWQICVDQFDPASTIGNYNYRPDWRSDADGAGEPTDPHSAQLNAVEIALNWPKHDENTLGDLVERLEVLGEEFQERVWDLIRVWPETKPSDHQKAILRERIRQFALTRRSRRRKHWNKLRDRAQQAYEVLEPVDPVIRNGWLFADQWVQESAAELEEDDVNFEKRDERIANQRRTALREIWSCAGVEGIEELCRLGNASWTVGWHLAEILGNEAEWIRLFKEFISLEPDDPKSRLEICISGFLQRLRPEDRKSLIVKLIAGFRQENESAEQPCVRLLCCAPFDGATWQYLDMLPQDWRKSYWQEVHPRWNNRDASDISRLVDELIKVNRPRAAFHAVHFDWNLLGTSQLVKLLDEVATNDSETLSHYRIAPHDISDVMDSIEQRGDIPRNELARLEFLYIDILDHTRHGIRNLETELSESPTLFMQGLVLAFKRTGGGEDPAEWKSPNSENRAAMANAAYSLLTTAKRIPGTGTDGQIDLKNLREWIVQVRGLCSEYAREVIGDQMIGQLLSHSPAGRDNVWPCEPVREVLEEIGSNEIAKGMNIGVRNSQGVTVRGQGGTQERELAAKYRNWSQELAFEYPFVSNLLEKLAQSYERDAQWWDDDDNILRRLRG